MIKLALLAAGPQIVLLGDREQWFKDGSQFSIDARSRRRGVLAIMQDGAAIATIAADKEPEIKTANDEGNLALGFVVAVNDQIMIHKVKAEWIDERPR